MIDSHSAMSQETHMLIRGPRAIPAQTGQRKPRGPVALKVPPPEEENPRVKCRDCGAFGHRSRSRRCPIRCGSGLLVPQPLEAREEKENQDPHRAQALQNPGTRSQTERDKKLRQHPALHKDTQIPNISPWAPGKKPPQGPTQPGQNPPKKPRLALSKPPEDCKTRTVSKASSPGSQSQNTAKSLGRKEAPERRRKVAAQVPSTGTPQAPLRSKRAAPISARPCIQTREPCAAHVAGQPLRMNLTRLHGDCWTSRFVTVDPDLRSEKKTSPPETLASQEKGDGAHSQLPQSVLYEDLQVSSTSEDSDEEGAHSQHPWTVLYEDLHISSTSGDSDGE